MTPRSPDVLSRYESFLDDVPAFYDACARPLPHVVRVNTIKTDAARAIRALEAEGVSVTPSD